MIPRTRIPIPLKFISPKLVSFKRTSKLTITRSSKSSANNSFLEIASFVERNGIDKVTADSRRRKGKLTQTKPILLKRELKKFV